GDVAQRALRRAAATATGNRDQLRLRQGVGHDWRNLRYEFDLPVAQITLTTFADRGIDLPDALRRGLGHGADANRFGFGVGLRLRGGLAPPCLSDFRLYHLDVERIEAEPQIGQLA